MEGSAVSQRQTGRETPQSQSSQRPGTKASLAPDVDPRHSQGDCGAVQEPKARAGETEAKKKVRRKRSGFGWLKRAFTLSEEEKREYEELRRSARREN